MISYNFTYYTTKYRTDNPEVDLIKLLEGESIIDMRDWGDFMRKHSPNLKSKP